ncbi:hypothetical protein HgNV_051 [Homarus gammarus nudivirus]|uniref:Uncharacterized protein n=1 Tax=Homarus gammarus nudivirus TaxID=2509616 RepID=A0A411HB91_9VIRU|nr:hypothetical protein KM727_gp51 [Homarus gammarus nudivirus]QBB28656.1 hypothetical protein HgNV_051 [Homarus gammarus nudivirus]
MDISTKYVVHKICKNQYALKYLSADDIQYIKTKYTKYFPKTIESSQQIYRHIFHLVDDMIKSKALFFESVYEQFTNIITSKVCRLVDTIIEKRRRTLENRKVVIKN